MAPSDKGLDGISIPLHETFNASVQKVAHPAIYAQFLCLLLGRISEKYPLYNPLYTNAGLYFFRGSHEIRPMCSPCQGRKHTKGDDLPLFPPQ